MGIEIPRIIGEGNNRMARFTFEKLAHFAKRSDFLRMIAAGFDTPGPFEFPVRGIFEREGAVHIRFPRRSGDSNRNIIASRNLRWSMDEIDFTGSSRNGGNEKQKREE